MIGLIIFLSAPLLIVGESNPDAPLISEIIKYTMTCASDMKIDFDVCLDLFDEKTDHTLDKYKDCKCMIPCIAKKLKCMSDDGKFQNEAIENIIENLKTPAYKEEAKRVYPMCKTVEGTNCVAGYNMFSCIMTKSPAAKEIALKLVAVMQGKI